MAKDESLWGVVVVAVAVIATSGCTINSRGAAEPMVRMRAEEDLDCPQKEIKLQLLEIGNRYKAQGCGRTKVYRTACDGLTCTVAADDDPAIPWHDRPAPDEPHR